MFKTDILWKDIEYRADSELERPRRILFTLKSFFVCQVKIATPSSVELSCKTNLPVKIETEEL